MNIPGKPAESCPIDRQDCEYNEYEEPDSCKTNLEPDPSGRNRTPVHVEKFMGEWLLLRPDQRGTEIRKNVIILSHLMGYNHYLSRVPARDLTWRGVTDL